MIRYKVVKGTMRVSPNVKDKPENSKFILAYPVGRKVKAVRGSIGIFCFDTIEHAGFFKEQMQCRDKEENFSIIRVEVSGGGYKPEPFEVAAWIPLKEFYGKKKELRGSFGYTELFDGVVCYKTVLVLD